MRARVDCTSFPKPRSKLLLFRYLNPFFFEECAMLHFQFVIVPILHLSSYFLLRYLCFHSQVFLTAECTIGSIVKPFFFSLSKLLWCYFCLQSQTIYTGLNVNVVLYVGLLRSTDFVLLQVIRSESFVSRSFWFVLIDLVEVMGSMTSFENLISHFDRSDGFWL